MKATLIKILFLTLLAGCPLLAWAQQPFKIGVVASMSGVYGVGGQQLQNGINTFLQLNGSEVAGRQVSVIYRDTAGPNPEVAKRVAQELLMREKVDVLAGFDFTPVALAVASLATQAKKPMVVMNAATSIITERSSFIVRTSFTSAQTSYPMGLWAARNGLKRVYITVADFGPGHDAATWFKKAFTSAGGTVVGEVALPILNPDYGPFLQRVRDVKPDAVFAFLPVGEPVILFYKTWEEKGLGHSGIRLIAPEGWVDTDVLHIVGKAAQGAISTGFYTPSNPSTENQTFLQAYAQITGGKMQANYLAVGAYDGMALLFDALRKTGGNGDGERLMAAMKGASMTSPRGIMTIDPQTRDVINTVYVREVRMVQGLPVAVDFDRFEQVRDMGK